ncbi:hypothetical protein B4U79_17044 [Dinothrombium tinctorium]|uniref:N-acetyltransferase domain-containing protein n=1 Tax=Dinothrombium tinctorium TaxID=1965070 RepID=A0A443Q8D9_9ACAR|nr:hypothetical protein B4U79_17044 [Dinothrombium tinctorium]
MNSNIRYRILAAEDELEASKLLKDVFDSRAPVTTFVRQNSEIKYDYIPEKSVSEFSKQQLSLVCEDISQSIGERIVGINICSKLEFNESVDEDDLLCCFLKQVIGEWLHLHPELQRNELSHKVFHIEYLAVKDGYENLGIATQLMIESLKLAKQNNFQIVLVEAFGHRSQRIFGEKLKFKQLNSLAYENFVFKGKKIFNGLKNPREIVVYEKNLDSF